METCLLFSNPDLSVYEQEALMFLYAYMPIGDVTDYSGDYYLENVRLSGQTRTEMPWGIRFRMNCSGILCCLSG